MNSKNTREQICSTQTRPIQILLVEDNRADARLFQCALAKSEGWAADVTVVCDGDKAVAYLERSGATRNAARPDLVILDLNLPKRSGAEVLKWIRTDSRFARLPAVLLSSNPRAVLIQQVQEEGVEADGYFTKPGDFDELGAVLTAIRRCYEAASLRRVKIPPKSAPLIHRRAKAAAIA